VREDVQVAQRGELGGVGVHGLARYVRRVEELDVEYERVGIDVSQREGLLAFDEGRSVDEGVEWRGVAWSGVEWRGVAWSGRR
jgi:hypothetical protein